VLVHTHSSKAGILGRWAARGAGIRAVVHTYHGFGFTPGQPPALRRALIAAERATRPLTTAFVCVSRDNLEVGQRLGVLDPARTRLIRSGFPLSEFRPGTLSTLRDELGVEAGTLLVGMVACLKPQKAPVDFVLAAARVRQAHPSARFVLAGDGELRPQVEAAIAAHGLGGAVMLLGWRRDVPNVLAALDVCVLTSRWEGLPRVVPQALAMGVPVVATAVDGTPEAIAHGVTGLVVPPGRPEAVAGEVIRLLSEPALRRRMSAAGPASVREFDAETMVAQLVELYDALV
jgi:glycosyltransferase involved in cell wall biosynthesis